MISYLLESTCDVNLLSKLSPLFSRNGELRTICTGAELEFKGQKPQPV
jgi:hypothetical protein